MICDSASIPGRQLPASAASNSLEGCDLSGKRILVTGANSGIGLATVRALAKRGASLWLACRSLESAQRVVHEVAGTTSARAHALQLDLADLASVRSAARSVLDSGAELDVLINNAGIAWRRGGLTRQGFELFFGVNHLGPFLLTKLLLPALLGTPSARVINVASLAHYAVETLDWSSLRRPTVHRLGRPEYCVSKLCNVLHAKELARRLPIERLCSFSLHPGVVASGVWRGMPRLERWWRLFRWALRGKLISHREGALTTLHCAIDAPPEENGQYFDASRPVAPSSLATDPVLARELWDRSEEWTAPWSA